VWIILAILEMYVFVLAINRFVLDSYSYQAAVGWGKPYLLDSFFEDGNLLLGSPFIGAGGLKLSDGLKSFNGKPITNAWILEHWVVTISLVLAYIAGPALFLYGLKLRKMRILAGTTSRSSVLPLIATAAGGYLVCAALLLPAIAGPRSWVIMQRMKADEYANAARGAIDASLPILAFQAQQLRVMPEMKGGGAWTKGSGGITIEELENVLPPLDRVLWRSGLKAPVRFFLQVDSPDSLTVWGVASAHGGYGPYGGSTFRNIDSTTGNVQVYAGVTPTHSTLNIEN
jgi:hypothetical protein